MAIEQLIYEALENCGRKKSDVAAGMGIPLSTLSRETSPYDSGAKFGAASMIPFMRETRSLAPLEYIADQMGFRLVPKNAAPDGDDLHHESLQAFEATHDFIQAANDENTPYHELLEKRRRAAKENDDVLERKRADLVGQVFRNGKWGKVQQ